MGKEWQDFNAALEKRNAELNAPVTGIGDGIGAVGRGMLEGLAESTTAGRILIDPFIETEREKDAALSKKYRLAVMSSESDKAAFAKEGREHQRKQWKRSDELQDMNLWMMRKKHAQMVVDNNVTSSKKNLLNSLNRNPVFMQLNDKQKEQVFTNPSIRNQIEVTSAIRLWLNKDKAPGGQNAINQFMESRGLQIVKKDGKQFLVHPEWSSPVEMNHTNLVKISNKLNAEAAREAVTMSNMFANESNLRGASESKMIRAFLPATENNYTKAKQQVQSFLSNFEPAQLRRHYMRIGLDKMFEDGNITEDEQAQLQLLAKRAGIKYEPNNSGGFDVVRDDGVKIPLQTFHKTLQQDDIVANEWQSLMATQSGGEQQDISVAKQAKDVYNAALQKTGSKAEAYEILKIYGSKVGVKFENPDPEGTAIEYTENDFKKIGKRVKKSKEAYEREKERVSKKPQDSVSPAEMMVQGAGGGPMLFGAGPWASDSNLPKAKKQLVNDYKDQKNKFLQILGLRAAQLRRKSKEAKKGK